jgi:GT2 family glycosyltransferase
MAIHSIASLILTYNDTEFTSLVCKNLLANGEVSYIVIVDNSDKTEFININKNKFTQYATNVFYINPGENRGYAAGNNIGINYILSNLSVDYIWIVNNDIIPQKNAADFMVETIKSCGDKSICGSLLYYYENTDTINKSSVIQCYGGGKYYPVIGKSKLHFKNKHRNELPTLKNKQIDFIMGASMMVPVNAFKELGFIPEEYFMYYEELDWQTSARKKGYKLIVSESSEIIHMDGLSTKNKKHTYYYYMNRAAMIFTKKHYVYFLPSVILYRIIEAFFLTHGFKNKYFSIKGIINGIFSATARH